MAQGTHHSLASFLVLHKAHTPAITTLAAGHTQGLTRLHSFCCSTHPVQTASSATPVTYCFAFYDQYDCSSFVAALQAVTPKQQLSCGSTHQAAAALPVSQSQQPKAAGSAQAAAVQDAAAVAVAGCGGVGGGGDGAEAATEALAQQLGSGTADARALVKVGAACNPEAWLCSFMIRSWEAWRARQLLSSSCCACMWRGAATPHGPTARLIHATHSSPITCKETGCVVGLWQLTPFALVLIPGSCSPATCRCSTTCLTLTSSVSADVGHPRGCTVGALDPVRSSMVIALFAVLKHDA